MYIVFSLFLLFFDANLSSHEHEIFDYNVSRDGDEVLAMIQSNAEPLALDQDDDAIAYFERIRNGFTNKFKKVIRQDNKTVAFIEYFSEYHKKRQYHINTLVVDKNYRKRGYATQLLQLAVQAARQAERTDITIHVQKNNVVARRLYEDRFGFVMHKEPDGESYVTLIKKDLQILQDL